MRPCHAHCKTRCSGPCPAPQVEGWCRWPVACDGPGCRGCLPMPIGVVCTCPGEESNMFDYSGELILRSETGEVYVRGTLREWQGEPADHTIGLSGVRTLVPGLRHWGGTARVQGAPRGLYEVLGEECSVILSDGRTGKAFVTAYNEESAWVIEIQGAGPVPSLDSSEGS